MTGEEYTQGQAYRRILDTADSVADLLLHAEVVVLFGYYDLSATERTMFEELLDLTRRVANGDGAATVDALRSLFNQVDLKTNVGDIDEVTNTICFG